MGFFSKEEKSSKRVLRVLKTVFFLVTMVVSFLLFSAPVLLVVADALLPSALLSASLPSSSFSLQTLSSHLSNYDFRYSLIDIPLISIIRSTVIICVYSFCDGPRLSRGPYLGITTICSLSSLIFVSLKASYVFNKEERQGEYVRATEMALFICSLVLAVGHVIVAYRTSCRERRKLLVYKIDIEAVSTLLCFSLSMFLSISINYRLPINQHLTVEELKFSFFWKVEAFELVSLMGILGQTLLFLFFFHKGNLGRKGYNIFVLSSGWVIRLFSRIHQCILMCISIGPDVYINWS